MDRARPIVAKVTRERLAELELERGQILWALPSRERVFA